MFYFQIVANKALEKDNNYGFIVDMLGDGIFTSKGRPNNSLKFSSFIFQFPL